MNGAVNLNTAHSPSVRSVFDEIQKYLKFPMFFPGIAIITSVS